MSSRYCIPCIMQKKTSVAVKFCEQCQESLCNTCVTSHDMFSACFGHSVVDNPRDKAENVPMETCKMDKHEGKPVEFYCTWHNRVGCCKCMDEYHRRCFRRRFLLSDYLKSQPLALPKILNKTDIKKAVHELVLLQDRYDQNRKALKKATENTKRDINNYKDKLQQVINNHGNDCLTEVQKKFDELDKKFEKNISFYGDLLAELKRRLDVMYSPKTSSTQKFVNSNILEIKLDDAKKRIKNDLKAKEEILKFSENKKTFANLLKSPGVLGRITPVKVAGATMPIRSKL